MSASFQPLPLSPNVSPIDQSSKTDRKTFLAATKRIATRPIFPEKLQAISKGFPSKQLSTEEELFFMKDMDNLRKQEVKAYFDQYAKLAPVTSTPRDWCLTGCDFCADGGSCR